MHCINYLIWSKRIGTKNLGRKKEINIRFRSISELLPHVAPKLLAIGPWKTLRPLHFDCLLEHRSLSPSHSGPNLQSSLAVHRKNSDTLSLLSTEDFRFSLHKFPWTSICCLRYVMLWVAWGKSSRSRRKCISPWRLPNNTTLIPSTDLHPAPEAWRSSRAGPRKISQPTLKFSSPHDLNLRRSQVYPG